MENFIFCAVKTVYTGVNIHSHQHLYSVLVNKILFLLACIVNWTGHGKLHLEKRQIIFRFLIETIASVMVSLFIMQSIFQIVR